MKLESLARDVARHTPEPALRALLAASLGDCEVALCLHRVAAPRRAGEQQPEMSIEPAKLDGLVELLLSSRKAPREWLTLTFDDGYQDAAEYIRSRAPRFPTVRFLFFVCPQKTEAKVGFRWDAVEVEQSGWEKFHERLDVDAENARADLQALAQRGEFALASVATCRELAKLPNVSLGNHTNCHFKQTLLTPAQAAQEYERSSADFRRLFGAEKHFAFPFGTPEREFDRTHVDLLRSRGTFEIWSTEGRPFAPSEHAPGAVLPRFPVKGNWSSRELAFWIATRALRFRARGTRFNF